MHQDDSRHDPLAVVNVWELSPTDYERYCASLLERYQWRIQMTPATRDGGADFIATKGPHRMVVQCKQYTKPVGNKAVQEVTSAVRLYKGSLACVVAPVAFTAQAKREAFGLNVHLLHHTDLSNFAAKLEAAT